MSIVPLALATGDSTSVECLFSITRQLGMSRGTRVIKNKQSTEIGETLTLSVNTVIDARRRRRWRRSNIGRVLGYEEGP
jgi:hypothetical protein